MADMRPRLVFVRDGLGKMATYLHECVGQDAIVSHFGPRYQVVFIRGEPCTIFFDKAIRYFIIAPLISKQEFADRPGRYDHIIDLDWMTADNYAAPAAAKEQVKGDDKAEEVTEPNSDDMDPDEGEPAASGSPRGAEKIPRPPNSWILFRRDKSKQLREANPNISTGEVSTEAARQWKALSAEEKGFYQEMARQAAEDHKTQYPDYVYRPARK
ncbi:hypothetical protein KVR01_002519 [Diaporthe batatas]|uniref:uncharacterized protein n=1 Tax=Diaporthe batatas TaxID=748121 RepID=UPI001D0438FD|nr:uncharacterized protein KVR01_002519 [Diaporthe batatas]KAG8166830.1 hypothetical protein KVR01_002519 [Diaporthe batatas]